MLLDSVLPSFVLPAVALVVALQIAVTLLTRKRPSRKSSSGKRSRATSVVNPKDQLEAVNKVAFRARPLLNASERRVLSVIDEAIASQPGLRVMAQASMGEIVEVTPEGLEADRDAGFRSINSKRVDFAIVDEGLNPVLIVEYQGAGHARGNADLRDKVKRAAFESAGISLLEIDAKDSPSLMRTKLGALLNGGCEPVIGRREPLLRAVR